MRKDGRPALEPAQRLIVAADFRPEGPDGVAVAYRQVLALADCLGRTGVTFKVNAPLRAFGYGVIGELRERGLRVFADLKLCDIRETLETDAIFLREAGPDLLTVMCGSGVKGMAALKALLPDTEVLGVTVLTGLEDRDVTRMYRRELTEQAVAEFAEMAKEAGVDGLIASGAEAAMLRQLVGNAMTINTPAIRPIWALDPGDQNRNRIMTPAQAIAAGADRIVVGRPIVHAKDPYDAAMRTIEEISKAA
ncbi:MAG: orotidine-5-phosphate decarboxylase [Candidatus Parcubacteria bacterium]|jgi:orotidine-5'-phosphate decarboxylase|nr:orotidine-5-phosphate decarboxylase [Candidatus Parcubacteria bacterium]